MRQSSRNLAHELPGDQQQCILEYAHDGKKSWRIYNSGRASVGKEVVYKDGDDDDETRIKVWSNIRNILRNSMCDSPSFHYNSVDSGTNRE